MNARQLRAARNMLHWTHRDLARLSGLSIGELRNLEADSPSFDAVAGNVLAETFREAGLTIGPSKTSAVRLHQQAASERLRPEHILGARGLLDLSSSQLARDARIVPTDLHRFETGTLLRLPDGTEDRLRELLASRGVEIEHRDALGPCVFLALGRVRNRKPLKAPDEARARMAVARAARFAGAEQLSPAQCRAARALLNWTISDLAARAKVSSVTVSDFENKKKVPTKKSNEAMIRALVDAGISIWRSDDGAAESVKIDYRPSASTT
jgi:transcriptional regulator with XRE-family HTH domain